MTGSADLLRRAAVALRQHAEAATPGPWEVDHDAEDMWFFLRSRAKFEYAYQADMVAVHSPDSTWADFDYIALMHPPVALALADALQAAATDYEYAELFPLSEEAVETGESLIPVARAVLREPEEKP